MSAVTRIPWSIPSWPEPTSSDWGADMTIAMAVVVDNDHIVTVTDRLVSFSGDVIQGMESVLKARRVGPHWGILFAASNADLAMPMTNIVLRQMNAQRVDANFSIEEVQNRFKRAYQELFNAEFSAHVLSRYRFDDVEEFRREGRLQLGDEKFLEIARDLESYDLGLTVIGYGHDTTSAPHVFKVVNPGRIVDNDLYGLAVAGAGQFIAMGALAPDISIVRPFESTLYKLVRAKVLAERASGVGKETTILVQRPDGDHMMFDYNLSDSVGVTFRGLPPPPPNAALLKQFNESQLASDIRAWNAAEAAKKADAGSHKPAE